MNASIRVSRHADATDSHTGRRADRNERIVTCRYLRRGTRGQCTAEVADPDAEILLCPHHLARVVELLRNTVPGLLAGGAA